MFENVLRSNTQQLSFNSIILNLRAKIVKDSTGSKGNQIIFPQKCQQRKCLCAN